MVSRTALYDNHLALKARMMEFGGWEMPLQYEGVIAEHTAVRTGVGIFDTSHMAALWVEGSDSLALLSRLVTQELRTLAVGACRYGFMLNESGGVIDDLIVYRMAEEAWMPVVNAGTADGDLAWMQQHSVGVACSVRNLRPEQGKLDVQGPLAAALLRDVLQFDLNGLRRFRWVRAEALGHRWIISRTGYTGEDGVELYGSHAAVVTAWEVLVAAGAKPCGLGARDTLRLEAGLPLYGHEFDSETSPAEAQMMRYCQKEEEFIGRQVLLQRAGVPRELLVRFRLPGRQTARHGQAVLDDAGDVVGRVTSGSYAPSLGHAIGFAYVKPELVRPGTQLKIATGRAPLAATVCDQ